MHDGIPMIPNEIPAIVNGDGDINGFSLDKLPRQYPDFTSIDPTEFGSVNGYDG